MSPPLTHPRLAAFGIIAILILACGLIRPVPENGAEVPGRSRTRGSSHFPHPGPDALSEVVLPKAASSEHDLTLIADEAVRTQPIVALGIAAELAPGVANDELIHRAAMEWAVKCPADALAWALEIEASEFRTRILAAVATAWAETDPVAAGTFAANELPAGRSQDDAVVGIAQRWVQNDPEAAAAWIASFPAGELKDAAIGSIAPSWIQADPAAAENWRLRVMP